MRVLILSDIHANLVALETVLNAAANQYDTIWCLGDVIGYGPKPNECVEIIRELATLCVLGNHDCVVLDNDIVNVDDFNPHARQAILWTQEQLTPENYTYLNQLPAVPVSLPEYSNYLITHASPREPVMEYIFTPSTAMENFAVFDEPICLFGHTHKPVVFRWRLTDGVQIHSVRPEANGHPFATVDYIIPPESAYLQLDTSDHQRLIINPGSVGQPRDNDARAAYAILELEKNTWQYERIAYPVELTQNQMREARLPRRLIDRISHGW